MRATFMAIAATVSLLGASPAMAAATIGGGNCMSDLTLTGGSTLVSCYGRFTTNVLNNSNNASLNEALDALGYLGPDLTYSSINAISPSQVLNLGSYGNSPNAPVNFSGLLNGTVFIGLKTGNGGPLGVGRGTTFYRINAVNLDVFTFKPQGASTAALLVTAPNPQTPVPEPSVWAMMIVGFGAIGFGMRRRRPEVSLASA